VCVSRCFDIACFFRWADARARIQPPYASRHPHRTVEESSTAPASGTPAHIKLILHNHNSHHYPQVAGSSSGTSSSSSKQPPPPQQVYPYFRSRRAPHNHSPLSPPSGGSQYSRTSSSSKQAPPPQPPQPISAAASRPPTAAPAAFPPPTASTKRSQQKQPIEPDGRAKRVRTRPPTWDNVLPAAVGIRVPRPRKNSIKPSSQFNQAEADVTSHNACILKAIKVATCKGHRAVLCPDEQAIVK